MTYTENDKLKALAIVHVFETSRPFGDYAACVVLDDGAGISYGINQFTHRSGSLAVVVEKYLQAKGVVGAAVMLENLALLQSKTTTAIAKLSANATMKKALRAAAVTSEMKRAQEKTAFELYLKPALDLCEKYGFTEPLSLAVIYDSIVHGSFFRVARGVDVGPRNEREWITAYVRRRDAWLASFPRLVNTRYRTRFFLNQIAISNWSLRTPLTVHGVRLTSQDFEHTAAEASRGEEEKGRKGVEESRMDAEKGGRGDAEISPANAVESAVDTAAQSFDSVESVVNGVTRRADSVKSMWTTIGGSVGQAAWAVFGFVAGLPREVWITVAVIAGLLMIFYLYRQIALGKIRERAPKHLITEN